MTTQPAAHSTPATSDLTGVIDRLRECDDQLVSEWASKFPEPVTTEEDEVLYGLHDLTMRTGISSERIRGRMRRDPEFRSLFTRVSSVWVLPAANLDAVIERLANMKARNATANC